MGYLIETGFIYKKILIPEADFQTCGTIPFLLLKGKPNMAFQFFSIMAYNRGSAGGYSSLSPYTIFSSITGNEAAATHFDNLAGDGRPCTYNLGVNVSTDNAQRFGNDLLISIRSGVDPTGTGDIEFSVIYKEIYF
jgi:hypothetical protein